MRRLGVITACLGLVFGLGGCVMFEVGVTNPVAGLTTVAVAPFFNLSAEPTVDGRRFAEAYFAELQKTPGFEVVPVGVVEQALHDHQLQMTSPDDALKLAAILNVDAVVVGAVTDYSPYYPPRVGLKVSWYSPYAWDFVPGIPLYDMARKETIRAEQESRRWWKRGTPPPAEACPPTQAAVIRGQSADSAGTRVSAFDRWFRGEPTDASPPTASTPVSPAIATMPFDPRTPLMSYTRLFDGADPKLTARLRDYRALSGDLRAGGWQAYLHRSEDFIRFTSHLMIVEMLQVHGGEAKHRVVFKLRREL